MLKPIETAGDIYISTEKDIILQPMVRQSIDDVIVLDDKVVVAIYTDVIGHLVAFSDNNINNNSTSPWTQTILQAAENAAVYLCSSRRRTGQIFYSFESFLTPLTLAFADKDLNTAIVVGAAPARFDASKGVVEQFEVTSTDGTKIPYFLVRPRTAPMDGSTPTLYGYGGFRHILMPAYEPEMGKLCGLRAAVAVSSARPGMRRRYARTASGPLMTLLL